jgi:hypothetical protein
LIAEKENRINLILDLAFFSKFTWKVLNLLKKNLPQSEGYDKLQDEFNNHLSKITELLKKILENQNQKDREFFQNKFYNGTPESFQNLLELIYDFTWIKNWCLENNDMLWK